MPDTSVTQRRIVTLIGIVLAVVGLVGLLPATTASAQTGESVETTLLAKPEDGGDRDPVEGAEIIVYEAVITDRVIESTGAEIGRGTSDATGYVSVALPGPGQYAVELNVETLPENVELVRADKQVLPLEARVGQPTRVLFNLAEGDAIGAARDKTSDGLLTRGARLLFEGVIFGLIIGLCAIGLSLIYGTTGLVNFALSEQIVFGALVAYFFNSILGINLIAAGAIALIFGGLGSAATDLALWRPLRKRGTGLTAMMIISIGLRSFLTVLLPLPLR